MLMGFEAFAKVLLVIYLVLAGYFTAFGFNTTDGGTTRSNKLGSAPCNPTTIITSSSLPEGGSLPLSHTAD